MSSTGIRHLASSRARIMIVDGSKLVRRLIEQMLRQALPDVELVACATGAEAKAALHAGTVDLVTTALSLPDMDGQTLAQYIREHTPQAYIPIIVVSGDVQQRLEARSIGDVVTDYFDKSLGLEALAAFIRGYVHPEDEPGGEVLYVEDSRVVATATRRMLEKHGLSVTHVASVEDALAHLDTAAAQGRAPGPDVVLTDVYLKDQLSGKDLIRRIRQEYGYGKGQLPVVVMTGEADAGNQAELIRVGANDLVVKPIDERRLITKLLFQLRLGRMLRRKLAGRRDAG